MSVIERATATDVGPSPRSDRVSTRQWAIHAAALVVMLAVAWSTLGPGIFTIDENAYRTQAAQLVEQRTWAIPTVPGPVGVPVSYAPLALSDVQAAAWYPYVRHATYPAVLAGLDSVAPDRGGLLLSAFALVVVALTAGLTTDRLGVADGRLAFWVAVSASPFLVHSQIGWAHLPAAAAFGLAVAAIQSADRWGWGRAVIVAAGIAIAVLLRTEALVAGVALAAAMMVFTRPGIDKVRWVATVGGSVMTAFVIDRLLYRSVTGDVALAPAQVAERAASLPVQRMQAAIALFLDVGGATPQHVARLLAAILLLLAAVVIRRRGDLGMVALLSTAAVVVGLYGALRGDPYPGVVAAWPILAPALILTGFRSVHRVPLATLAVAWLVLVAIIPADGGGLGWGGRLGIVVLVVTVPIVAAALSQSASDPAARLVLGAGLLLSVVVGLAGLRTVADARETSVAVEAQVETALEPYVGTDQLLISTDRRLGRIAPDVAVRLPLQSLPDDSALAGFLAAVGNVDVVVHLDLFDNEEPVIPDGWRRGEATFDGVVRTILLERVRL